MQSYKSSKNLEYDRKLARRLAKQAGEIPFEIEPNHSIRITTKFAPEFIELPFILLTPVVGDDQAFDVMVALTARTKKEFTINVQNTNIERPVKGSVLWYAE